MNFAFMYDPYVRNSVKRRYLFHCLGNCVNKVIRYHFVFLDLFPLSWRKPVHVTVLGLLLKPKHDRCQKFYSPFYTSKDSFKSP